MMVWWWDGSQLAAYEQRSGGRPAWAQEEEGERWMETVFNGWDGGAAKSGQSGWRKGAVLEKGESVGGKRGWALSWCETEKNREGRVVRVKASAKNSNAGGADKGGGVGLQSRSLVGGAVVLSFFFLSRRACCGFSSNFLFFIFLKPEQQAESQRALAGQRAYQRVYCAGLCRPPNADQPAGWGIF